MKAEVFVILLLDSNKITGVSTVAFGTMLDVFVKREDAEFMARTVHSEKKTRVVAVTLEVTA